MSKTSPWNRSTISENRSDGLRSGVSSAADGHRQLEEDSLDKRRNPLSPASDLLQAEEFQRSFPVESANDSNENTPTGCASTSSSRSVSFSSNDGASIADVAVKVNAQLLQPNRSPGYMIKKESSVSEVRQIAVHDNATDAANRTASHRRAGNWFVEKESEYNRRPENRIRTPDDGRSPSNGPSELSSHPSVACDTAWPLHSSDLINAPPTIQETTAMPAYNLKTQGSSSSSSVASKEGGGGGGSSSGTNRAVFQCPACLKEFVTEKYLCMHMALHRSQSAASSTSPISSSSSPSAANAKQFSSKMSIPQSTDEAAKLIKSSDGSGASHWTCKICSKTFAQSSNYKNHIRTHSDERPFVCNVCSIGFKERYHLKKHILFKHSDELKEECRVCGKRFKDSTAVRAHERIHSEERPYGCQRCDKTFKTSECLWHHENRSRTCGKSMKGAMDADGGGAILNTMPRFRRGRHPGKRTGPAKGKTTGDADDGNGVGEMSAACLNLDHVEEISASVKIELEKEIPEYYFKTGSGLYPYEFENIMDVLSPDSLSAGQEVTFTDNQISRNPMDNPTESRINQQSENEMRKPISNNAILIGQLDHIGLVWSNEWNSNNAGVFLGSPSRPVSASYDSVAETYSPGTPEETWKQDIVNRRHGPGMFANQIPNTDLAKSSNFIPSQHVQQQQQQQQQQNVAQMQQFAGSSSSNSGIRGLPYSGQVLMNEVKAETSRQETMQRQVQQVHHPYTEDYGSAETRPIMSLTSMTESGMWPTKSTELTTAAAAAVPTRPGERIPESSSATSYSISIPSLPTAVVAPFKRESVGQSSNNGGEVDQPVKNSLPPFETFAPMTLRVQKSQHHAMPPPPPAIQCPSPVVASYSTFASAPLPASSSSSSCSDASIANQCPTIQKYLLRGHPNVSIKPNRVIPEESLDQYGILPINCQWQQLLPPNRQSTAVARNIWKRPNIDPLSNHTADGTNHVILGRHHIQQELRGFVPGNVTKVSGSQGELFGLPGSTAAADATESMNFRIAAASYSQSAILQPLMEISESSSLPVNIYHQI